MTTTLSSVVALDPVRVTRPRRYLMCRPTYFGVDYAINPWMDPSVPVDRDLAIAQWNTLRETYLALGHKVALIAPVEDLPDMVFAANGAFVVDGKVLGARFYYDERLGEGPAYRRWFEASGYAEVVRPRHVNEGEGDFLTVGRLILAGTGFRTEPAAHAEAQQVFGRPVVSLELVDPRYYHLDTALCVLDDETVAYYPQAFSEHSREILDGLFPTAILATDRDAEVLGLNAVSDGRNVVVVDAATELIARLAARGYHPVPVDLSELRKAGGGPKCCTLELRTGA